MTKKDLIEIVNAIKSIEGKTEEDIDRLIEIFRKNVPHPAPTDLIYYEDLTNEEVVDKALSYRPLLL
jgi:Colicin immunity protein / pyocin immunity protein